MRRFAIASLLAGGLLLAGCAAPHDPEVTFFADGKPSTSGRRPCVTCTRGVQADGLAGRPRWHAAEHLRAQADR
ncbi:hypothetical protein [Kibdelosporangium philippinense]|uniref:hypothetical protein n=1 Tax=Kibdelosporangium philippinense TaxID=211113 RepID=UPI00360CB961